MALWRICRAHLNTFLSFNKRCSRICKALLQIYWALLRRCIVPLRICRALLNTFLSQKNLLADMQSPFANILGSFEDVQGSIADM